MTSSRVIVFGPTGNIASVAAQTAQERGAKVFLAMRDPQKTIQGLSAEQEKQGGYERVQADLTKPDTISSAVSKTQAKRAFIYLAHGASDHMKSTIEALKSSGIEFVVFLSSYTVTGDRSKIPPEEIIPFLHAQVELNLEEIYGPQHYVAVRPAYFATNIVFWKSGINAGEVKLYSPDAKFDHITPMDMGRVSGTILSHGQQQDGQNVVYLMGPQIISQRDAIAVVGKALNKDVKIKLIDTEEGVKIYTDAGVPEPVARYVVTRSAAASSGGDLSADPDFHKMAVANVQKYSGKPATGFQEWVEGNKGLFTS